MIHGQNTVKLSEVAIAEEVVGRIRSEGLYALACQLVDGRNDDFLLLVSAACLLIVLGVECQHGDTWIADVEVALDGLLEEGCLLYDSLCRDLCGNLFERQFLCHRSDAQRIAHEDAESLLSLTETGLDVVLVSLEGEALDECVLTVDRCCHQHIIQIVSEVGHGSVECLHRSLSRLLCRHTHVHLHLLLDSRQKVDASFLGVFGLLDDGELRGQVHGLAVVGCHLGRAIDDRRAKLQHLGLCKGFKDQFVSDTIGISMGESHPDFLVVHFGILILL